MSPFGTGLLSGLSQSAQKQIDQKHDEQEALKKEKRQMYWSIAYDSTGKYSDAQKQAAQQELGKLLSPDAKKGLAKFSDIFSRLSQAHQQQQQSAAPPQQGTPAQGGTQLGTPQTPLPQSSSGLPPIMTDAEIQQRNAAATRAATQTKLDVEDQEYNFWLKKGKEVLGKDANPRDLAEYAGSKGQKLPPVAVVKMKPVQLDMKDGQKAAAMVGSDGKYYDLQGNAIDGSLIKGEAAKESSAMPRFDSHFVTLEAAKQEQEKMGTVFHGLDGNEIDLNKVPQGMVLQPAVVGGKFLFMPITEDFAKIIADNQVKIIGKQHEGDIAQGGGVVAGQARVPTVTESTPEGIGGRKTVSTPQTGAKPTAAPAPQQAATPPQAPPVAQQPNRPATPQTPTSGAQTQGAKQDTNDPVLPGVSVAVARQAAQQAAPVAAAVTEIYGDPNQPDLHPLQSYAKLSDNKKSQERIGKAIQLTLNGFGDGIKDAAIGVGAGPIHVSAGGWGTWLDNKLKGPQAAAGSQAETLRKVIGELTPEEREAYDSTMATMSTMAGLRSISRQSAAMGSLQLIEREIPKIGLNVSNSKQFYDQLQRTAGAISTFMNTPMMFPRVQQGNQVIRLGFTPEMQKRISQLTSEMEKKKSGGTKLGTPTGTPKPPQAGAKLSADGAAKYLQAAGNDRAKAEAAAKKDGWSF